MRRNELLITVYRWVDPYLYGSISVVREEDILAQGDVIDLSDKWSFPYIVSKQMQDGEIVYGSILHLIGEVAKPIFRLNHRLRALEQSLPEDTRSSMQVIRTGSTLIHQLPASGFPASFLHQQEELFKEGLLLSGLHLRTLLEIYSGKGNKHVRLFDYDGNSIGEISLNSLFNTLIHHRYCVFSGGFVHDMFSGDSQLESPRLFGSKVNLG